MPSVPIGAYVPGDSFFHKIHPFVKFYWVLSFVFFCFFNKNPYINYGVALIGIAMVVLAKTFPSYLRTMVVFGPATFAMIFLQSIVPPAVFDNPQYLAELGPFSLYTDSIIYGMLFSSRILCIVTWSILMLMTLHPGELSASLQRAKVPYTVNFMITTTLQLIPIMQREFSIILSAQKSRAMETRAFGSKNERTLMRYKEFSKRDTFLSISALTPIILSMYAKFNLNSFIPSTGFSLSPNVGVFIVAFCGIAFLTIIFGAGFAIRLFGKK